MFQIFFLCAFLGHEITSYPRARWHRAQHVFIYLSVVSPTLSFFLSLFTSEILKTSVWLSMKI